MSTLDRYYLAGTAIAFVLALFSLGGAYVLATTGYTVLSILVVLHALAGILGAGAQVAKVNA
jgi:hypothetical protein